MDHHWIISDSDASSKAVQASDDVKHQFETVSNKVRSRKQHNSCNNEAFPQRLLLGVDHHQVPVKIDTVKKQTAVYLLLLTKFLELRIPLVVKIVVLVIKPFQIIMNVKYFVGKVLQMYVLVQKHCGD